MARGSTDLLTKTNSKLESFLKRVVSDDKYERIRAYESCIVDSERENKAFKYVILGDEWIYLTENPPKTIQETVPLRDVVSVDLVNEYPDFLTGSERENSQHITITYMTSEHRKRARRRSKKSGSLSELSLDRSNASTPLGYAESVESFTEDYGYSTQSTSSLQASRPNSRGSVVSNRTTINNKKKKKQLNDSLDQDSILRSLKEELEEELDSDDRLSTIHSVPSSSKGPRSQSKSPRESKPSSASRRPLPSPRNGPSDTAVSTKEPKSPQPKTDPDYYADSESSSACGCARLMCGGRNKNQVSPVVITGSQTGGYKTDVGSVQSDKHQLVPEIEIESDSIAARSSSPSVQHFSVSRLSIDGSVRGSRSGTPDLSRNRGSSLLASTSDLGDSMNGLNMLNLVGSEPGLTEKRRTVIHIYLLNLTSPMLMLIRSAWNNYLIRCTLLIDPAMEKTCMSTAIRGSQGQRLANREKTELLFNQLKRELFNPSNNMEELYRLLTELQSAAEKNFALKKLFWRNSDLFLFLVRHLQKYLPKSPSNMASEEGRSARADEFEFVILLTEILSLMFRETEIIQGRIQTLKAERGKAVLDLLMALTCVPEMPEKHTSPTKKVLQSGGDGKMEKVSDEEISQLVEDFTKVAIKAVFELFLMARQANWNHSEGNFFNISWMVRVLEEIRTTEKFVERVTAQMMELISPSKFDTLSPEEGVALYQQFSLLLTFLEYSPRITKFIRQNYHEEFKYFIQVPKIARKLNAHYPVSCSTRNIMDQVIAKVLCQGQARSTSRSPR